MSQLPAEDAIQRFTQNEERLDKFVNDDEGYTSSAGQAVESIPAFLDRVNGEISATGAIGITEANKSASAGYRAEALTYRNQAESFKNEALVISGIFATTAAGIAGTTNGKVFAIPAAEGTNALALYKNEGGTAVDTGKRLADVSAINQIASEIGAVSGVTPYVAAFADVWGNVALGFRSDGTAHMPKGAASQMTVEKKLSAPYSDVEGSDIFGYVEVVVDSAGNLAFGIKDDGTVHIPKCQIDNFGGGSSGSSWKSIDAGSSDSIVVIGDSYTASHYTITDKAYICNLSHFLNYRVRNFGISGNDALDMNYRIVNDSAFFDGMKMSLAKAKYALIVTYTNDGQFWSADLTYYQRNVERLVESVKALGVEPIICTEFPVSQSAMAVLRTVARKYNVRFIDCNSLNREIGNLQLGPFHQGHPGTRTNGVFWLPMLEELSRLPEPDGALKVFRRRPTFAASTSSDLLYTGIVERYKKFKEISISHYRLSDATLQYFDELDGPNVYTHVTTSDEYNRLADGSGVAFGDYGLIEATLPGTARTIEEARISLTVTAGTEIFVRDWLDSTASIPGRAQGATPTLPEYLAKWDKPRGAWRSLGTYGGPIIIPQSSLSHSMDGDKMQILLYKSGGFTLNSASVDYRGGGKVAKYVEPKYVTNETELLPISTVAAADLASWTVTGSPTTLVPIDQYNAPRNPANLAQGVAQVCVISANNKIGQTVTLPNPGIVGKRYKLVVWARYFAKAFLNNTAYNLDASQVIDRTAPGVTYEANSPINKDTNDIRTLRVEYSFASTIDAANGVEVDDFAWLGWRGVEFPIDVPASPFGGTSFTFRLSCPDGEIQIAKVQLKEILQ